MFSRNSSNWEKLLIVAVVAVVGLILVSSVATADSQCKKVSGKFTLQPVTGSDCTSPVGVCATGTYKGDIKGISAFTGSSFISTVDTPTTSVFLLTGDNLIETDNGDLTTKDAIVLSTTGAGDFAEVDTVIGGTGEWAGATGFIKAIGTFTAATGGEGEYVGEVCTP